MNYYQHCGDVAGVKATAEPLDGLPFHQAGEVWAPKDWPIAWHVNRGWEIYFQAKGESVWETETSHFTVPENGAYLIRNDSRHRLRKFSGDRIHFFWVIFPAAAVPPVMKTAKCWRQPNTVLTEATELLHPLQGIINEVTMEEKWRHEACEWHLALLCTAFSRLSEMRYSPKTLIRHPGAHRAHQLLAGRLEHPWRLGELARLAGVSVQHLTEIFRHEYGQSPIRALKQMRLEEARRRLQHTNSSVTEIALEMGFSTSQHFARACRLAFGKTPTQLRGRNHFPSRM